MRKKDTRVRAPEIKDFWFHTHTKFEQYGQKYADESQT